MLRATLGITTQRGKTGRDFSYKLSIPIVKSLVLLAQAGHWLGTENSEDSTDMINISERSDQPKLTCLRKVLSKNNPLLMIYWQLEVAGEGKKHSFFEGIGPIFQWVGSWS